MKPHRKARFTAGTKGIRLRPDQIEWVEKEILADAEQSWSRIVREGIEPVKKKRDGLIQVLMPSPR